MAIATDGWQDPALQWSEAFERVCELVAASTEEALDAVVPATPAWRARDLLAHVVGLDHDVLAGDEPDDHDAAWTQRHVDDRADLTVAEILEQWRADAEKMTRYLREQSPRPLADAVIHEQDLRGALGAPGGRDTGGQHLVRVALAGRLRDTVRDLPGRPRPLRLESGTDDWTWESGPGTPGAVLRASAFDLTRALSSRRTADQLRSYVVAGDVDPYLDAFAGLGPLPEQPLRE